MAVDETISLAAAGRRMLGQFELLEIIGGGAFGTVWKGRDCQLDRIVAIKVPRAGQLDRKGTDVFLGEARAAARLKHPNIVSIHEVGRDQETLYIVSDLVDGVTLSDWLTGIQPTAIEAASLCAKIALALDHAHEAGIVHRDLKPSNVMLDKKGEPHVMDFGLAKREEGELTVTADGKILGTPAYMSPEQARGESHSADRRSDVYSLGVILFEMLTGEKPFRGNTRMLLHQVLNQDAPPPRSLNAYVPRDIESVCLKCLEKDPRQRYSDAKSLADDLLRFTDGRQVLARPISRLARGYRWCRRNILAMSLATAVVTMLLVGTALTTTLWLRAERALQREAVARTNTERLRAQLERQTADYLRLLAKLPQLKTRSALATNLVPVAPPEPAPPTGVALEEQPDTDAQPLAATPATPSAMPAEADSDELLNRFRELENISASVADSLRAAGLAPSMIGD